MLRGLEATKDTGTQYTETYRERICGELTKPCVKGSMCPMAVTMPVLGCSGAFIEGEPQELETETISGWTCYNIIRSPLTQPVLGELSLNVKNWGRRKGEK